MNTEERLIDIEVKIARQEDVVDTLNRMVYEQQKKIEELEGLCSALAMRIKEMSTIDTERSQADDRPPHY